MITKKIIEKIEGEADLFLEKKGEIIDFATISFEHFRGFETILQNKNALDALVYTPRICGICGHSHLYATVRAIESAYENAGFPISISQKATAVREITLMLEIIQNHIKWIYLSIIPQLKKMLDLPIEQSTLKAAYGANLISKIIAIFSGQYPHSSYMLPGGITSDLTYIDTTKALHLLQECISFLEKEFLGIAIDKFLEFNSCKDFNNLHSDIAFIEQGLIQLHMHKKGHGYDRFLVLGEHSFTKSAKIKKTVLQSAKVSHVSTQASFSPNKKSYAKNALYKKEYIEVGPLPRAMANGSMLIKNMHRRYKDSSYSRVLARCYEIATLIQKVYTMIDSLQVDSTSFNKPVQIDKISATGIGIVEAPRGTLIHTITIQKGKIQKYEIITPTQFNLASGHKEALSVSQQAMKGLKENEVEFVFRSFDVCSVCTTH